MYHHVIPHNSRYYLSFLFVDVAFMTTINNGVRTTQIGKAMQAWGSVGSKIFYPHLAQHSHIIQITPRIVSTITIYTCSRLMGRIVKKWTLAVVVVVVPLCMRAKSAGTPLDVKMMAHRSAIGELLPSPDYFCCMQTRILTCSHLPAGVVGWTGSAARPLVRTRKATTARL
jgi:hypothetical protein